MNTGDCIGPGWARSGFFKLAGCGWHRPNELASEFLFVLAGKCDQNQGGGRRIKGEHGKGPFGQNFRNPGPFDTV